MRTNSTDIADFYRQISLLLKSGLPLPDSILQLGQNFEKNDFKKVLLNISEETSKGETLAKAMKKYPQYFTDFQIRMIEAGEKSGMLPETLSEIATTSHLNYQLTSMVREISVYPVFVVGFSFTVLFTLIAIIIPEFRKIFEDMLEGEPLPWLTEKVMSIGETFSDNKIFWIAVIVLYIIFFLWLFSNSNSGRKIFLKIISFIPGANNIFSNLNMSRLTSMWSVLLRQTIPTSEALLIISDLIDLPKISLSLKRISKSIHQGTNLVEAIEQEKSISSMIPLTIKYVPEKELPSELANLATLFRERASIATKKAGVVWGLLLIIFITFIVGIIVLSMFLPLISLIRYLGGG